MCLPRQHRRNVSNNTVLAPYSDRPLYSTQLVVEWADLPVIDLAKAATPEGRAELAPKVRDAMTTHGFLYVINHGWTETQVRHQCIPVRALSSAPPNRMSVSSILQTFHSSTCLRKRRNSSRAISRRPVPTEDTSCAGTGYVLVDGPWFSSRSLTSQTAH